MTRNTTMYSKRVHMMYLVNPDLELLETLTFSIVTTVWLRRSLSFQQALKEEAFRVRILDTSPDADIIGKGLNPFQ